MCIRDRPTTSRLVATNLLCYPLSTSHHLLFYYPVITVIFYLYFFLLQNYRLDFNYRSKRWHGAAATIVPDNGKHVWGALWEIGNINMESLDR